jgi:capsular polysaccharide biosynthesis protein
MLDSIGSYVLWLDRYQVARRNITNQEQIIDSLRRITFKVIKAYANQNISEILALYSKADYIIGSYGAMFVNTIFASKTSTIMEICPESRKVHQMLKISNPARNHILTFWNCDENCIISIEPSQMIDSMKALD